MTAAIARRILADPSWTSVTVLLLVILATALMVISITAWSSRND